MRLLLQDEEVDALERVLDFILVNENLSQQVFAHGAERRCIRRISKKISWSRPEREAV
jgi:hypothetical protein